MLITAVLFAPVGIFLGIKLLIRDYVRPGLAIIFTAVALWGAAIALVLGQRGGGLSAAQRNSAYDPSVGSRVEKAIETKVPRGDTISNVRCVATSKSTMTCQGQFTSK